MTASTTTIDGNLNHCKMHVQSDAIDQSEGGNLAVTCHQKCCEEKHLEAKIDHYRKVAKLADKYHILCRYSPNYESYPQNIRWRLAFMVMDFPPLAWLGLHVWIVNTILPRMVEYSLTFKHGTAIFIFLFWGMDVIKDCLTVPIRVWLLTRHLLSIYLSDTFVVGVEQEH